ncbi:hypothetical protein CLV98_10719 [Dyadobacter jejuensis]|uniref:Uncharacterized protein n=1 Tax=Dyadobacter jejuensis TaxID=1082580 RepID=A0A316AI03_9BACT|nr:hypothetical protein CLV98_10719 [Dyadobacter jejuensis]
MVTSVEMLCLSRKDENAKYKQAYEEQKFEIYW